MEISSVPGSSSTLGSKIQLFSLPQTDMSMKEKRFLEFVPLSDNVAPVEFLIPSSDMFVDLNRSYFSARIRLKKADNNNIEDGDKIFPIINPLTAT